MNVLLVIPVYNEDNKIARCVEKLVTYLKKNMRYEYKIVIVDNGSIDRTLEIGRSLEIKHRQVEVVHIDLKGRGRALKKIWKESSADILSYMDVDLSTDLDSYPTVIQALVTNQCDIAVGSRLLRDSQTKRSLMREIISRCYNLVVRMLFHTRFSDAQCGFKGITRNAAQVLLPLVDDNDWFFDTELLVWAENIGYNILDIPVKWEENPDSRVQIVRTAVQDIKGILRLRKQLKYKKA